MVFKKLVVCTIFCILAGSFAFAQEDTTKEKLGINVSAGYSPGLFIDSEHIGTSFSPIGFNVKITYIPLKRDFGNIGVEFAATWLGLNTEVTEGNLTTNAIPLNVNFVYQYRFNNRLMLDSHVGLGLSLLNLKFDDGTSNLTELGFSLNVGASLQIDIAKDFYGEVGLDYIIALPKDVFIQMIVPVVSAGYRF